MLGVRVPEDVSPDAAGVVMPGTGGMSVAPDSMWNLPNHRRPRGMERGSTGPVADHVFSITEGSLGDNGLTARPDPDAPGVHALVEPRTPMLLVGYEGALTATRASWQGVWS